jgi:hypothetical protein
LESGKLRGREAGKQQQMPMKEVAKIQEGAFKKFDPMTKKRRKT